MRISLREAHRIEKRVTEVLNKQIELFQTFSIFDEKQSVSHWYEHALRATQDEIINRVALIGVRGTIRAHIQETNAACGINIALGNRKKWLDLLGFLKHIEDAYEANKQPMSADILLQKKNARKEKAGDASTFFSNEISDTIRVFTLAEDTREAMVENVRKAYRDGLDADEDRLAQLNVTAHIEFSKDIVDVLKANKIV
ncbi:MAG: hypothetical protein ACREAU_00610 [Nitrosopumilaceae archaeon]